MGDSNPYSSEGPQPLDPFPKDPALNPEDFDPKYLNAKDPGT